MSKEINLPEKSRSNAESDIVVDVISDSEKLLSIQDAWDRFMETYADHPLLFSGFVKEYMDLARSDGWTPMILVFSRNDAIIGVACLMTRTFIGIRRAKSISDIFLLVL